MADSSYVQRAELLADLGRYDEAAAELVDADDRDVAAQTLLARVKLAAGRPREALRAADAAIAVAPSDLSALIARGMVLADLGRVDEAASQAEQILRVGSGDGYACTSAAAILAEVRNGQVALDAAWEGVRLTPDQPRAHLVLGVVAARLGLEEIAARAYQEALTLDPRLPVAQTALGVARLEQLRYAQALSHLAEEKPAQRSKPHPSRQPEAVDPDRPPPLPPGGKPAKRSLGPVRGARPAPAPPPRPPGAPPPRPGKPQPLRSLILLGCFTVFAPLWVVWAHTVGIGAAPTAVLLAIAGMVIGAVAFRRLPVQLRPRLAASPRYAGAGYLIATSVAVNPLLLVLFVVVAAMWPLLVAAALGGASVLAALTLRGALD